MDRETTRYLSAATQLSIDYAKEVARKVINEPFRALAPAYGVDVGVVARWAADSLLRRLRRDLGLAFLLVVGILLAYLSSSSLLMTAGVIGALLIVAWVVVSLEYWVRAYRVVVGQMLREVFDPESAPEPRYRWVRTRIEALSARRRGNLVVFRGRGAFVGSGDQLSKEHVVIDVSRGRKVKNGKPQKPRKFTNADVHAALISAMRKLEFADMRVQERLFVNGRHLKGNRHFLPDGEASPPATSVEPELIHQAVLHPTPDARAYVCAEMPGWQGQLVVTLFARAVHTGGSLYIEWEYRVLPPLKNEFLAIDRCYGIARGRQLWQAHLWGARRTLPALVRAPFVVTSELWHTLAARKQLAIQRRAIKGGQAFDYGASRSIREDADGGSQHHFLARDEIMYVMMSQQALTREIRAFLRKHDVSLGAFDSQVEEIHKSTFKFYNVHLGNVTDSVVAVGDKSRAKGESKASKSR
jgi:hypothetical protein